MCFAGDSGKADVPQGHTLDPGSLRGGSLLPPHYRFFWRFSHTQFPGSPSARVSPSAKPGIRERKAGQRSRGFVFAASDRGMFCCDCVVPVSLGAGHPRTCFPPGVRSFSSCSLGKVEVIYSVIPANGRLLRLCSMNFERYNFLILLSVLWLSVEFV